MARIQDFCNWRNVTLSALDCAEGEPRVSFRLLGMKPSAALLDFQCHNVGVSSIAQSTGCIECGLAGLLVRNAPPDFSREINREADT